MDAGHGALWNVTFKIQTGNKPGVYNLKVATWDSSSGSYIPGNNFNSINEPRYTRTITLNAYQDYIFYLSDYTDQKTVAFNGTTYINIDADATVSLATMRLTGINNGDGFPNNPTLDVGNDGDNDWSFGGPFLGSQVTGDVSGEINDYLVANWGSQQPDGTLDVPLYFETPDGKSNITISEIDITYAGPFDIQVDTDKPSYITNENILVMVNASYPGVPITSGNIGTGFVNVTMYYNHNPSHIIVPETPLFLLT